MKGNRDRIGAGKAGGYVKGARKGSRKWTWTYRRGAVKGSSEGEQGRGAEKWSV